MSDILTPKARGLSTGGKTQALPGTYPIIVFAGDTITVNKIEFDWIGATTTLYFGWGLKPAFADFNNGANLIGGAQAFGISGPLVADMSVDWVHKIAQVDAPLLITDAMGIGGELDTWIWLSTQPTTMEINFIAIEAGTNPSTDADIVTILSSSKARSLQVAYVLVPPP